MCFRSESTDHRIRRFVRRLFAARPSCLASSVRLFVRVWVLCREEEAEDAVAMEVGSNAFAVRVARDSAPLDARRGQSSRVLLKVDRRCRSWQGPRQGPRQRSLRRRKRRRYVDHVVERAPRPFPFSKVAATSAPCRKRRDVGRSNRSRRPFASDSRASR